LVHYFAGMRRYGCGLGVALLLLAVAGRLAEIMLLWRGAPTAISLGWLWFQIHANSLVGFQALIEKAVSPALWPPIQTLLTWPLWLALGIPGVLLALSCLGLRRQNQAVS
jgi:hypothetical protein